MASGRKAGKVARAVYRKARRMPKRVLAKKYANAVGQIVRKKPGKRVAPSRGRGFRRKRKAYRKRPMRRRRY